MRALVIRIAAAAGLAAGAAAAPLAPALASGSFEASYGIYLAGFPIGRADVASRFDGRDYAVDVQARLTGLAGLIVDGRGAANAAGRVRGDRVAPASFAVVSSSSRASRTIRMGMRGDAVAAVEILPPLDEHPDRVPVRTSHRRGVVDPVSAFVFPALARLATDDPRQCDRTIPVFDGASRFDITLRYSETRSVDKPGYSGPVLVCRARFRAIAGHRPDREAIRFMEANEDMAVWLAPAPGARTLAPIRVEVATQVGMSVIEANRVAFGGAPTAPPAQHTSSN